MILKLFNDINYDNLVIHDGAVETSMVAFKPSPSSFILMDAWKV